MAERISFHPSKMKLAASYKRQQALTAAALSETMGDRAKARDNRLAAAAWEALATGKSLATARR